MRVLVVSPQPYFSPRGTPLSVYYRTLITAELGAEIDLLTYGEGQDSDIDGVTIHRIPRFRFLGPVPVGPSLRKAWLDFFLFIWTFAFLIRRRYDFVHAHEEAIFFLRCLKPVFRFKLVYDMHSSLPQQLTNFGYTRSKLLIKLFKFLEKTSVTNSDAVITISPAIQGYAQSLIGDHERVFLIENSICEEVRLRGGNPINPEDFPLDSLPAGRPIVAYAGTFESYQGVDLLLKAHARVVSERTDAFLLLMGGTPRQIEAYRSLANDLGIGGHCLFAGLLPRPLARIYLQQANVAVSPRTTGGNTPMKIYELIAAGIPLVATRVLSHTQILDESICVLVDPDPVGLAEGILSILQNPQRGLEIAAKAMAVYEAKYSRDAYVRKMQELLAFLDSCAE